MRGSEPESRACERCCVAGCWAVGLILDKVVMLDWSSLVGVVG